MTRLEKQQLILKQMEGMDNSDSWVHWLDAASDVYEDFIHAGSRSQALPYLADLDLLMCIVSCKALGLIPAANTTHLNYDIPFLIKRLLREDETGDQLVLVHSILARIRIHAESYGFRDEELDAAWMEKYNEMIAEKKNNDMKTKLDSVKDFRLAFGLPISDKPCVPSVGQLLLHAKMIKEESNEILDAIKHGPGSLGTQVANLKIRDVSGDLYYFALGLAAESGVEVSELNVLVEADVESSGYRGDPAGYQIHKIYEEIDRVLRDMLSELLDTSALDMQGICFRLCILALALDRIIGVPVSVSDSDFEEIHAANMRKLWTLEDIEGHKDLRDVINTQTEGWTYTPVGMNKFVVRLNGKVQKPPGWVPAQLEGGVK